jgi:hypothetical protein
MELDEQPIILWQNSHGKRGEMMVNTNLFCDLLRYGKMKADFEVKDAMGRYFRVRVFEHQEKKYFTVMCDGEMLRCEEV